MNWIRDLNFLRAYHQMPDPGGVLDQCPRFLEAAEVIEDERAKVERALAALGGHRG